MSNVCLKKSQFLLDLVMDLMAEDYTAKQKINIILEKTRDYLDMKIGIMSKITDDTYEVVCASSVYVSGDKFDLCDTFCELVKETDKYYAIGDIQGSDNERFKKHPLYKKQKLMSYVSFPVRVNGEFYGTFGFNSTEKRKEFTEEEIETLKKISKNIQDILEGEDESTI